MGAFIDLTGKKYGRLTVLCRAENNDHNKIAWHCSCDCGKKVVALGARLKEGSIRSCGCFQKETVAELGKNSRKIWQPILCDSYSKIPLNNGEYALVDTEDLDIVKNYTWYKDNNGYVRTRFYKTKKAVAIHSLVLPHNKEFCIDHISMNKLDNRKSNLRVVTYSKNSSNTNVHVNNTSGYRGVTFDKSVKKWRAYITRDKHINRIGRFDTPELAAKAYDEYCRKYDGNHARLNFPNEGELSCLRGN